jgi:hypothetical protein
MHGIAAKYLDWFYCGSEPPAEILAAVTKNPNVPDAETFYHRVELCRAIFKMDLPLPDAKFLLPHIIVLWNKIKGGADQMTRCITDHTTQLPPAISSAQNMVVQRTIGYLLYGIYRGTQVLSTDVDKVTTLQKARWNSNKRVSMRDVLLKMSKHFLKRNETSEGDVARLPRARGAQGVRFNTPLHRKGQAGGECAGPFLPVFNSVKDKKSSRKTTCAHCRKAGSATWFCFGCEQAFCSPNKPQPFQTPEEERDQFHYVSAKISSKAVYVPNSCWLRAHPHLTSADDDQEGPPQSKIQRTE